MPSTTNAAVAVAERFEMIELASLQESPLNPRKHFNQHKLEELAASIRERGVITPLIVRYTGHSNQFGKTGAVTYEIAAGHRRFRAAKLAGVSSLPCRILELDDEAFLEIVSIENLQREDIHPLEEADGFRELLRTGRYANAHKDGYDVATLADKIGKTEAFVRGRLELCDLTPVVRESFLQDNITIGHARLISRLPAEKQEEALRQCFQDQYNHDTNRWEPMLVSVGAFRRELKRNQGADLSRAPFALDDATLKRDAGPCTACPKCSGVQRSLLADDTGEQTCMDRSCYSQKVNAFIMRQTAAGLVAISTRYPGQDIPNGVLTRAEYAPVEPPDTEALDEEIASLEQELRAEELDTQDREDTEKQLRYARKELADTLAQPWQCPYAEQAIIVHNFDGDPVGGQTKICRNVECPIHGDEVARGSRIAGNLHTGNPKERSFADIWKEKRKNLDDKIRIEAQRELQRQVYEACPRKPDWPTLCAVAERMRERIGHDVTAELVTHVLKLESPKLKNGTGYDTASTLRKLLQDAATNDQGELWRLIVLMTIATVPGGYGGKEELESLAKVFGIDQAAITKQISQPLIERFNQQKASAKKKADAAAKADKPAKKKPGKSSKMAAAGDIDEDEDGDE